MIRRCFLALTALLAWTAVPVTASDEPLAGLDEAIEAAREQWHAPGMAVAIVKDDQVVYARGFGTKHLGRNDPVDHRPSRRPPLDRLQLRPSHVGPSCRTGLPAATGFHYANERR